MSHSVLVLDESVLIQGLITSALADSVIDVHHEQQPERFLETAKSITPDLIFISNSDEKQGYDVCQKFKADLDLGNVPLIVLTNSSDDIDSAKLKELNIEGVLRKPFEASLLQEHVKKFIPTAFPPSDYDEAQSLESKLGEHDEEISVFDEEMLDLIKEQSSEPEVNEDDVPDVDFSDEVSESIEEEQEVERSPEETMMQATVDIDGSEDELVFSEISDDLETIDASEFEELDLEEVDDPDEYAEISLGLDDPDEYAEISLDSNEETVEDNIEFEGESTDDEILDEERDATQENPLLLEEEEMEVSIENELDEMLFEEEEGLSLEEDNFDLEEEEEGLSLEESIDLEEEEEEGLSLEESIDLEEEEEGLSLEESIDLEEKEEGLSLEEDSFDLEEEEEEGLSLDDDEISILEEDLNDGLDIDLAEEPGMEDDEFDSEELEEEDNNEVLNLEELEEDESITSGEFGDESFDTENTEIQLTEDDESEEFTLDSISSDLLGADSTLLEEYPADEDDLDNKIVGNASGAMAGIIEEDSEIGEEIDVSLAVDEDSFNEKSTKRLRERLPDIQLDLNDFEEEPLIGGYDDLSKQSVHEGLEDIALDVNDFDPEMPESLLPNEGLEEQEYNYEITEELNVFDNQVIELQSDEQGILSDINEDHFILSDSKDELQEGTMDLVIEESISLELDEEGIDLEIDLESSIEDSLYAEELDLEESFDIESSDEEDIFDSEIELEPSVEETEESLFGEELDVEEMFESDEESDFNIEESGDESISLTDDIENKDVEAITKDDVFEEDLDGSGIFEDINDTGLSADESLKAVEEKALSALNDLDQEMGDLEKKDHDLHLDDMSDSPTIATDSEDALETLEGESSEMALFHDELDESPESDDVDFDDSSSIFNDSTEGEDMEIATELDTLTVPPIMETELELADEDFNSLQTDHLVFQIDPDDGQQELLDSNKVSTQQLGQLLEDVISSSVQKSLENSIPSIVEQILTKMKEQS